MDMVFFHDVYELVEEVTFVANPVPFGITKDVL
jgi:hypothetical protein